MPKLNSPKPWLAILLSLWVAAPALSAPVVVARSTDASDEILQRIHQAVEVGSFQELDGVLESLDRSERLAVSDQLKAELAELHDELDEIAKQLDENTLARRHALIRVRNISTVVGSVSALYSLTGSALTGYDRYLEAPENQSSAKLMGRARFLKFFYKALFSRKVVDPTRDPPGTPRRMKRGYMLNVHRAAVITAGTGLLLAAVSEALLRFYPEFKQVNSQLERQQDLEAQIESLQKAIEALVPQLQAP